ncbi:hypothetical protein [Maridesulfovibrio ferrireducens]|uniref:hypothetical protein n=1 Tax=Maridesulfovibrio ferrireducens TaxID=246191 RepID=UPI001A2BA405|nr:hypothetical protein [Maridesulfovibrio ferrireducens]MBI9110260.1 hypothetical protein [Maridesulfovibrio ferrireducens]
MKDAETFERIVIEEICLIAEEKELNHSQLARAAFGDSGSSITRWRQFRHPRKNTGKPQSLTIADTYRLCVGLGIDFGTLTFRAGERFKMQIEKQKLKSSQQTLKSA